METSDLPVHLEVLLNFFTKPRLFRYLFLSIKTEVNHATETFHMELVL